MIISPSNNDEMSAVGHRNLVKTLASQLILEMKKQPPQDNPPSYDFATESGNACKLEILFSTYLPLKFSRHYSQTLDTFKSKGRFLPVCNTTGRGFWLLVYRPTLIYISTDGLQLYQPINRRTSRFATPSKPSWNDLFAIRSTYTSHTLWITWWVWIAFWYPRCMTNISRGVLAAIFWFPLGIGLCLLDKRVKCERCGLLIEDGICGWRRYQTIPLALFLLYRTTLLFSTTFLSM